MAIDIEYYVKEWDFSFTIELVTKDRVTLKGDFQLFISSMPFANEHICSV